VDALEVVHTDGPFGGAAPHLAHTDAAVRARLRPLMSRGVVPVVPGFLGAWHKEHGQPPALVTLGRGGSDLTATLLGRALEASRVTLWKDVPGLLTADPRVVPDARVIPQLHVREAAELPTTAPRSCTPARLSRAGQGHPGLRAAVCRAQRAGYRDLVAPEHGPSSGQGAVRRLGSGSDHGGRPWPAGRAGRGCAHLCDPVGARDVGVAHHPGLVRAVHLLHGSEKEARAAKEHLDRAFHDEIARRDVDGIQVQTGMTTIAVVGLGMAGMPGIAARVFSALASQEINVVAIAQGSSELNISLVVSSAQAAQAQKRIHSAFRLSRLP